MQVALRNLSYLSMPGSEIPNWFTPKEVRFSKRKNHAIKAVIFAFVVSINHQIPDDDRRDQIPAMVDIQARILRSNRPVCTSVLDLMGVPNTHEDQVYFCRYDEYRGLVLMLDDGDKIEVAMQDPPFIKGVELKKCGVHMVYENDDDYGGDEESLAESQQSVSQKLTRFIESSEEDKEVMLSSSHEVEREVREKESKREAVLFSCKKYHVVLFLLSLLCVVGWCLRLFRRSQYLP